MKHDNLEVAHGHLSAARRCLVDELLVSYDTHSLCDAYSLTADAISQLEAEMESRDLDVPRRGPYLGGASA